MPANTRAWIIATYDVIAPLSGVGLAVKKHTVQLSVQQ